MVATVTMVEEKLKLSSHSYYIQETPLFHLAPLGFQSSLTVSATAKGNGDILMLSFVG
jgi:hypothetical protein